MKRKAFIRYVLFNSLGRISFRTNNYDDVIILSSSRSGSTWLLESLQNTNEFKVYNQPFDIVLNNNVYQNILPKDNPYYVDLNSSEERAIHSFWDKLLQGNIYPNVDWRIFSKNHNFSYSRKLIKIFFLKDHIDFFLKQKKIKVIYLIRNPLNRGLSNINYGYKDFGDRLFRNKKLISEELDVGALKKIYQDSESILTKHIISWFLENYIILKRVYSIKNQKTVLTLEYEKMVKNKETHEKKIEEFLSFNKTITLSKVDSKTTNKRKKLSKIERNYKEIENILKYIPSYFPYSDIEDYS